MGVYIKGMEMPKENEVICIFQNGIVQKRVIEWSSLYEVLERSNAIPIPPHGRLGDLDKLALEMMDAANVDQALAMLDDAPTIIPASEEAGE